MRCCCWVLLDTLTITVLLHAHTNQQWCLISLQPQYDNPLLCYIVTEMWQAWQDGKLVYVTIKCHIIFVSQQPQILSTQQQFLDSVYWYTCKMMVSNNKLSLLLFLCHNPLLCVLRTGETGWKDIFNVACFVHTSSSCALFRELILQYDITVTLWVGRGWPQSAVSQLMNSIIRRGLKFSWTQLSRVHYNCRL